MQKLTGRFLALLNRLANWKIIVIVALLFIAFDVFLLPLMASPGGQSLPLLDTKFWYTPQQASDAIAQYSPQARQSSVVMHLTLDLLYPALYGLLISLLLIVVFRKLPSQKQEQIPLLPWRAALADVFENIGLSAMFLLHPTHFALLDWVTTIFTALKWLQIAFSLLVLIVGLLLLLLGKFKRRV